jgi:hypothetical protein
MKELARIPMFPLAIFPLPGELVPLHIFEPRYRQLLQDLERRDSTFGIHFNHVMNADKLGSLMKLESVIKRHPGGESDVIVRCIDLFEMSTLYRHYKDKLYPGGDVYFWKVDLTLKPSLELQYEFKSYLKDIGINRSQDEHTIYDVANELSLDAEDRLRFVGMGVPRKEAFLRHRIKYLRELHKRMVASEKTFHLN